MVQGKHGFALLHTAAYTTNFVDSLPIKAVLKRVLGRPDSFASVFPSFLGVVVAVFPHAFSLRSLLLEEEISDCAVVERQQHLTPLFQTVISALPPANLRNAGASLSCQVLDALRHMSPDCLLDYATFIIHNCLEGSLKERWFDSRTLDCFWCLVRRSLLHTQIPVIVTQL